MPTPEEKTVFKAAVAQQRAASPNVVTVGIAGTPSETAEEPVKEQEQARTEPKKYKFVKLYGVTEELVFDDKTSFTFRLIMRNDGTGYSGSSIHETSDEVLAKNLREIAKNPGHGIKELV